VSFLVDANIIVYAQLAGPHREACLGLLEAVASGASDGRTSAAVLEEVWHLELSGKVGDIRGLTERAYTIFAPLVAVSDEAFRIAMSLDAPTLGAADRLHAGTCRAHGLEAIASADADFDALGWLRRIDPSDRRAWQTLLR